MKLSNIIKSFEGKEIIVIGDLMLDEYIYGDVTRINPEAPVPILNPKKVEHVLGGAGNTVMNIHSLGGKPFLIGKIGSDEDGMRIKNILAEENIEHMLMKSNVQTIKKQRIIARSQQVIRIDWEKKELLDDSNVEKIIEVITQRNSDIIIVSDYAKGMITRRVMEEIKKLNKKIIVDPKVQNMELYHDVFAIKPNELEAIKMAGLENSYEAGKFLSRKLNTNIIMTMGNKGARLFSKDRVFYVPTKERKVYDVAGAGDTFIATLALVLVSGGELNKAVHLANITAGLVVEKVGTSVVRQKELLIEIEGENSKIKTLEEMKEIVKELKSKGKRIVSTNGCFDILHSGHLELFKKAKAFGDVLIVALNSDNNPWFKRKPGRPINSQQERAEIVSGLEYVDYVFFFEEERPNNFIKELEPDIHVKGGDYNPNDYENMPEARLVHEYGGEVKIIPLVQGKSTTNIIKKIQTKT